MDQPDVPDFDGLRLKRVLIVLKGDPVEAAQIQSVEMYEDGVIVRWVTKQDDLDSEEFRRGKEPGVDLDPDSDIESPTPVMSTALPPDITVGASPGLLRTGPEIRLTDDRDTEYLRLTHYGAGDSRWFRGEEWFVPAIPPGTQKLVIGMDGTPP